MRDVTVNRFREARGAVIRRQIDCLVRHLGREIKVLDVGGRPEYWRNVGLQGIGELVILNNDPGELSGAQDRAPITSRIGDARDLSEYADGHFDLVHSNSVIEHVGTWGDMMAMAREVRRVGRSGWVQTPAWEFPIEPHFRAPFLHWFAAPLRARMLGLSVLPAYRGMGLRERRANVDRINLLSYREMRALFDDAEIYVERILVAKSYSARWMPAGVPWG